MLKVQAIKVGAVVSVFIGVFAILGSSSPSYATPVTPSIIVNTFSTPEDTTLVVPATGVATGATDPAFIAFYTFGSPSTGSFSGLTTVTNTTGPFCPSPSCIWTGTTDGSFTYDPPSNFTGTVFFIVQGALTDPPQYNGGGSFDGTNAVTDSIVVTGAPATPLPAALPLFASGLGALGLLGWRRKRKAAAVAV